MNILDIPKSSWWAHIRPGGPIIILDIPYSSWRAHKHPGHPQIVLEGPYLITTVKTIRITPLPFWGLETHYNLFFA